MRRILIMGASSGIGKALAQQLLNEGETELILASRNRPDINGEFTFQPIDVTEDFQLELPDSIDGLVYCPGSINLKPFHRFKDEEFLEDFNLNFMGAVKTIRQALPALKKGNHPSIVLFSTVAVQTGLSFHTSIAAAKGAIEGFTRSLASELAPTVRVNAIAPSLTDTPMAERLLSSEDKKQANAERHPLKRVGTVEDMASAAKFLLTESSSWITAQILGVDGGLGKLK